ncbi:helix-turn-helix domain-containing protein, partial [Enterobacter roggenkampii]
MQISRADVADLIYFMAIARHRSFSRAAIELGKVRISRSFLPKL